jgi:hypothetical protein
VNPVRNDRVLPHLRAFLIIRDYSSLLSLSQKPTADHQLKKRAECHATKFVTGVVTFSVEITRPVNHLRQDSDAALHLKKFFFCLARFKTRRCFFC